jgi:hypothetical protein
LQAYVITRVRMNGSGKPEILEPLVYLRDDSAIRIFRETVDNPNFAVRLPKRSVVQTGNITNVLDVVNVPDQKRFSQALVDEVIRRHVDEGVSQPKLAQEYGVSQKTISSWVRGYRRSGGA